MDVLIAGAGVGGLTAALALHEAGVAARVLEAARTLRPLGVGVNLLPHAVRELTELGLGATLAATAIPTGEMVHFDRHGGRIWGEPRGRALGYDWPQYSLHRGELQMALLAAVRERLGPGAVLAGTALESFAQDAGGVTAHVRDRASGARGELRADVLVGADGLHSAVRAALHPGEPAPLWNGVRMWRGVTEAAPFLGGRTMAVAGSNTAGKLVVYPISLAAEERGTALLNWVAEVRTGGGSRAGEADWNRTGDVADVLAHFAGWRFPWLDVPALLRGAPEVLEYPMVDRDPLPSWTRGRVTLLGDAAHPMYPIGSNGASQAVLDARVLAFELARAAAPEAGLAAYEAARREPVNAIVLACRDMPADRVLHTVAERAPGGFARIEDVLSADELAAISGAYRATSFSDAAALNARPSLSPGRAAR
ncbi:flavin-dependent oxidoreductase [Actinomadura parmotrematis]|uniref:Flavin-dependent oxidoreductase n=1 Tax=Actinomadura parmotrematis TaxID=2864039 RepID=A0ABS7FQ09_9ACTN|nr:flavin-dependent oxidoreductase [Actinomadura parmotrematis]MBW8482477.1 flavin-dependent oxidoreductase [Actinomadura parmotrematis]